jgi:hypothetical protein
MQTAETDGQMHKQHLTETYKNRENFLFVRSQKFVEGGCNGANDAVVNHNRQQSVVNKRQKQSRVRMNWT